MCVIVILKTMSDKETKFKVGDTVRYTEAAYSALTIAEYRGTEMRVSRLTEKKSLVYFIYPKSGKEDYAHENWLELATPPDLKAEKALLLARVAEIDKSLAEQAQGDGLSRLRAILEETGYFRVNSGFYHYDSSGGIDEEDIVGYYRAEVHEGYSFFLTGGQQVEADLDTYVTCFASDLEGWSSIPRERFLKAKSDYEAIVSAVKEAMRP